MYFGGVIGRVANRIHNGKFTLDGADYELTVNSAPNHLHGGFHGFHKVCHSCYNVNIICGMIA